MVKRLLVLLFISACGGPATESDGGLIIDDGGLIAPDAGEVDAGVEDSGVVDAGVVDAGLNGRISYAPDSKHSPMNAEVVAHLQAIAALNSREANVLSKIGDSNTVGVGYLQCFAGSNIDLDGRVQLDAGLAFFRGGTVDGGSAFTRTSLAATIGWSAQSAVAGDPSPIQQEVDAANPRYATVMFGTNDVGFMNPDLFGRSMVTAIDTLSMQGVVPIITSVPPRDDDANANAWVPRYNLLARAIAQTRKIPFIDLHRELVNVPAHGLSGDGIHLSSYSTTSGVRPCVLTAAGLDYGQNVRNLATLEALDRTWRAVESGTTPDVSTTRILGSGLPNEEIVIDALPFIDGRDTRVDGATNIASYPGCTTTNESGPEVLYKFTLTQQTNLRAFVVSLGGSDIDIHLLSAPNGTDCIARNDKVIAQTLQAGTYWLSLDTYESSSAVLPGEYLLVVMAE
jgi:lysophospholipase L1-like esterase